MCHELKVQAQIVTVIVQCLKLQAPNYRPYILTDTGLSVLSGLCVKTDIFSSN